MDIAVMNFIQNNLHNSFTDFIFPIITSLGDASAVWLIIGLCLIITKKYRRYGILLLAALALTYTLVEIVIKPTVARPRPFEEVPGKLLLIAAPHGYSFPSGHAASSFCAAVVLLRVNHKAGWWSLALAALISFSRVFLFVHYPSDVLAGALVGVWCALLVINFTKIRKT